MPKRKIFKKEVDDQGNVTKTFTNPFTGKTRTTEKYRDSGVFSSSRGKTKKRVTVKDSSGQVTKKKSKTQLGVRGFDEKGEISGRGFRASKDVYKDGKKKKKVHTGTRGIMQSGPFRSKYKYKQGGITPRDQFTQQYD